MGGTSQELLSWCPLLAFGCPQEVKVWWSAKLCDPYLVGGLEQAVGSTPTSWCGRPCWALRVSFTLLPWSFDHGTLSGWELAVPLCCGLGGILCSSSWWRGPMRFASVPGPWDGSVVAIPGSHLDRGHASSTWSFYWSAVGTVCCHLWLQEGRCDSGIGSWLAMRTSQRLVGAVWPLSGPQWQYWVVACVGNLHGSMPPSVPPG